MHNLNPKQTLLLENANCFTVILQSFNIAIDVRRAARTSVVVGVNLLCGLVGASHAGEIASTCSAHTAAGLRARGVAHSWRRCLRLALALAHASLCLAHAAIAHASTAAAHSFLAHAALHALAAHTAAHRRLQTKAMKRAGELAQTHTKITYSGLRGLVLRHVGCALSGCRRGRGGRGHRVHLHRGGGLVVGAAVLPAALDAAVDHDAQGSHANDHTDGDAGLRARVQPFPAVAAAAAATTTSAASD